VFLGSSFCGNKYRWDIDRWTFNEPDTFALSTARLSVINRRRRVLLQTGRRICLCHTTMTMMHWRWPASSVAYIFFATVNNRHWLQQRPSYSFAIPTVFDIPNSDGDYEFSNFTKYTSRTDYALVLLFPRVCSFTGWRHHHRAGACYGHRAKCL